ncbi:MAG: phage tail tape measure protein [Desulfobulbaceae bacterium]|nr:phage tail tape measure protein [Desulfobulbaceae bacterium]
MADMKLFLELVARAAGFKSELNSSKGAVTRFARGAKAELDAMRQAFGSVQGQLATLGVSIGVVKTVMDSARLDKSLTQIGQTAGEGSGKVAGLRADLFRMSKESGQGVEDLKDGINALVQSGLDMKEAKSTLDGVNIAMAVTGSNAETLSAGLTVAATAFQFDLAKPGQALEMLDKMTVAGRLGNAELENLSGIFARVGVNAASAGMGFEKTLGFIEGLSMVERNPERLATLADSTMRVFTNLRYMADAQKGTGVKFFDADGSRRDALAVLADIKAKYDTMATDQERAVFVQKAFGHADLDTIKGIKTLLQGDALTRVGSFVTTIGNAGGTLKRDMDEATANLIDQGGRLKNTLREAADSFAAPIKETLAGLIQWSLDKKKNGGLELSGKQMILGGGAGLLGTALLARYGGKAIGALANRMLKGGSSVAVGVAQGKAIEAATGVQPVFVTNWPAGGISTVAEVAAGGAAGTAGGKVLGWLSSLATTAAAPLATAGLGMTTGGVALAGLAGYGGAKMLGADDWGAKLGSMLFDLFNRRDQRPVENKINLQVAIDERNRVTVTGGDARSRTNVNTLRRGDL